MNAEKAKEACKQIEYYFSDANFTKDAFLQKTVKDYEGCPISIINKFARMKKFELTDEEVEGIVKTSEILEVSDKKIRRKYPVPENYNSTPRTLLIKNFPLHTTLEEVEALFKEHEDKIARIAMRKNENKTFKGSIFLELKSEEDLPFFKSLSLKVPAPSPDKENDLEAKKQKLEENFLEVHLASAYLASRPQGEKDAKKSGSKKKASSKIIDCFKDKIFKYSISTPDAPSDSLDEPLKILDIKAHVPNVAFADIPNQHIRLKVPTESLPPTQIKTHALTFTKLSEDEVEAYCKGLSLDTKGRISKPRK